MRYHQLICETVNDSQLINIVSYNIAKYIKNATKKSIVQDIFNPRSLTHPNNLLTSSGIKYSQMNLPKVNDPTIKLLLDNVKFLASEIAHTTNKPDSNRVGEYDPKDRVIILYLPTIKSYGSGYVNNMASTISHELRHALDDMKSKHKAFRELYKNAAEIESNRDSYLKLPLEVNARLQQAMYDIYKVAHLKTKEGNEVGKEHFLSLINWAFNKNNLDKIYQKDDSGYRQLVKRAYKFFEKELNDPKKATPTPGTMKRLINWLLEKPTHEINEESLDEYKANNEPNGKGLGATGYNANVEYRGLSVLMKPSVFLQLAFPLEAPESVEYIKNHLRSGGAIGSPYLLFDIPEDWENGKFTKPAWIIGHEGRNRMLAILDLDGDDPVEVHMFPQGELRARHMTPDIVQNLQKGIINQNKSKLITGPLFTLIK